MESSARIMTVKDLRSALAAEVQREKSDPRPVLTVSAGTCGRARGSLKVIAALEAALAQAGLRDQVNIRVTGCHGFCQAEPNIIVQPLNIFYQKVEPQHAESIVEETIRRKKPVEALLYRDPTTGQVCLTEQDIPFYRKQSRLILGDNERLSPTRIEDFMAIGGWTALVRALAELGPEKTIEEISLAGLRGRGGAGFPTGLKWQLVRNTPSPNGEGKYLVCNADEGDPGAYMDRSLLEGNPYRVLEGMMIGALAIGASAGYIYVRNEYPLAVKHVSLAVDELRKRGLLGANILGTGFDFDVFVKRGAGAFVCGEETALLASIEGRIGEPRSRPPYPAQSGLWGKPTCINNVETWANVPTVISLGAKKYSGIGTATSKGTKVFSLVGKIQNTGLVEVPMGMTLKEIITDIGGGIPGGKAFKAVQTGGPSGGCIPREKIDLPIHYESLNEAGSMMGSGGMVVMDEDTCMVDVARYFLSFTRDESCGKCTPCREGTQAMLDILTRITDGRGTEDDLVLLESLARSTRDTALCGLGKTAPNPVLSTLRYFREEYLRHIQDKKCPARVCRQLNLYSIDPGMCVDQGHGCDVCRRNCASEAISGRLSQAHTIDPDRCTKCGVCFDVCRFGAVRID